MNQKVSYIILRMEHIFESFSSFLLKQKLLLVVLYLSLMKAIEFEVKFKGLTFLRWPPQFSVESYIFCCFWKSIFQAVSLFFIAAHLLPFKFFSFQLGWRHTYCINFPDCKYTLFCCFCLLARKYKSLPFLAFHSTCPGTILKISLMTNSILKQH